ncbi:amino acid ABC transporter permease [Synechococcus sp. Nb3U1]|uniref:amino acid ABC transporter permease n=1 Tax=Synechococcus sp. Nb3U1 TaxID=1914529 RepID=UPI001F3BB622|nr:amino acid ABC transporter permease [Synechococcus sp. Nb3U1]MCF2971492.1 amino acid ABC transporter permease [Synechococcus sp. Nb3U1]
MEGEPPLGSPWSTALGDPPPPAQKTLSLQERWIPLGISVVSVAVVFGSLACLVGSSEQWPRIQRQFFNGSAMLEAFPAVLRGFWTNLAVWGVVLCCIAVWALVLAVFRSLSGPWFAPLRLFTVVYIDLFRGLPALLLVLLFGFGIPALQIPGLPRTSLFWAGTAMVLSYSAYAAEVYRSGMEAVHEGQRAAAKALGLSQWQTLRYAIVPQAVRNVLPALLNLAVALQKDVALLSVVGVRDAVREAQIYTARTFNYSSLVAAALLFLVTSIPLARFTDTIARRDRDRRLQRTL